MKGDGGFEAIKALYSQQQDDTDQAMQYGYHAGLSQAEEHYQAIIDRLTAQLALAEEGLRAVQKKVVVDTYRVTPDDDDELETLECRICDGDSDFLLGPDAEEDLFWHDGTCPLQALEPTDPDIDAAVQAMQAGRRVLDREWLIGAIQEASTKTGSLADAIIAKLKEAQ